MIFVSKLLQTFSLFYSLLVFYSLVILIKSIPLFLVYQVTFHSISQSKGSKGSNTDRLPSFRCSRRNGTSIVIPFHLSILSRSGYHYNKYKFIVLYPSSRSYGGIEGKINLKYTCHSNQGVLEMEKSFCISIIVRSLY